MLTHGCLAAGNEKTVATAIRALGRRRRKRNHNCGIFDRPLAALENYALIVWPILATIDLN